MRKIVDYSLYRHRYLLGYSLLTIAVVGALVVAGLYIPGALRSAEIDSAIASTSLSFQSFDPSHIINLPYYLLQRGAFELLGFSTLSIKLVSVIFGIVAVFGIFLLVKEWFRTSIAIITALIAFTCPLFIFMAQDGTPQIYTVAVSAWLLYTATVAARRRTLGWKTAALALMALNVYTPLGIYLDLAIITVTIFHPHTRFIVRKMDNLKIALAVLGSILLAVPLFYSLSVAPEQMLTLLGIPATTPNILANLQAIGTQFVGVTSSVQNSMPSPFISFGFLILALIGLYQNFRVFYTARSYVVLVWALVLLPIVIMSPMYLPNLYLLFAIWAAFGMSLIITTWYTLFPLNPYARVIGLIPIVVVVAGISLNSIGQYAYNYTYSPTIRATYRDDLDLFAKNLPEPSDDGQSRVVTTASEGNVYELYKRYNEGVTVLTTMPQNASESFIMTRAAYNALQPDREPSEIITDSLSTDADRFYIYTPAAK